MQVVKGFPHFICDPGSILSAAGNAFTMNNNGIEIPINGKFKDFFFEQLLHAGTYSQFFRKENKTRIRTPPEDIFVSYQGKIPFRYVCNNLSRERSPPTANRPSSSAISTGGNCKD